MQHHSKITENKIYWRLQIDCDDDISIRSVQSTAPRLDVHRPLGLLSKSAEGRHEILFRRSSGSVRNRRRTTPRSWQSPHPKVNITFPDHTSMRYAIVEDLRSCSNMFVSCRRFGLVSVAENKKRGYE